MSLMYEHFSKVSPFYNEVRTTDLDPILYIRDKLPGMKSIRGADVGCGGGRYDLLLLQHIPGLHLTCGDANTAMIEETVRYLKSHGQHDFSVIHVDGLDMGLPEDEFDCIFTFNAIHHFDPIEFLNQAVRALRKDGYIFIYTRLTSQNARTIWGRFFPGFTEMENRLPDLAQVENWMCRLSSIVLEEMRFFELKRVASLTCLVNQARKKHYSTFSLYTEDEFVEALNQFERQLERIFPNPEHIEWSDGNIMIVFRKEEKEVLWQG